MKLEFRSRVSALFALSLAILIWMLATVAAQAHFPFGNDAIGYIGEASNVLQGRGLVRVVNQSAMPDIDYAPTEFQPPGFALSIAGVSLLGLSVQNAALAISRLAWALLPLALLFALRPILPLAWAIAVTTLTVLSPGIYLNGPTVNTDLPTLLLIVLAAGLLFRGVDERPRVGLLLATGLVLGLAYTMRNSVTAFYAGLIAALSGAALLRLLSVKSALVHVGLILLGSVPVIALLLVRNLLVFGELQPYMLMVGVHATLLESFRVYLHGLLWDITGSSVLAKQLAWDAKLLAAVSLPLLALLVWGLLRHWRSAPLTARFATLFAMSFVSAGAAMLVIAHTYHGLDFGYLLRHMMQYVWLLLALFALVLAAFARKGTTAVAGAIFLALLTGRLWFIVEDLRIEREMQAAFESRVDIVDSARPFLANDRILTDRIKHRLAGEASVASAVQELPEGALILSNMGQLLGFLSGRPVRTIPLDNARDLSAITARIEQVFRDKRSHRPVYLVIVPDNRIVRSPDASTWKETFQQLLPTSYRTGKEGVNLLIMEAHPIASTPAVSR